MFGTVQDISRLLWAMAVLQALHGDHARVLTGLCASLQPTQFSPDALVQIFQAHLVLEQQPSPAESQLPAALVQRGEVAWRQTLVDAQPSQVAAPVTIPIILVLSSSNTVSLGRRPES